MAFEKMQFTGDNTDDIDDDFTMIQINSKSDFNSRVTNKYLLNLYHHSKLYGYPFYKLMDYKGRFQFYGILKNDFKNAFADLKFKITTVMCNYDDEAIECVIIDHNFFDKLYKSTNTGLKTCIAQLTIFEDDLNIINKCANRIETYAVPKIAINLMELCTISPQYDITGYRTDGMFQIKSFINNIPGICLEIDENGHSDRDPKQELNREQVFKTFGHRFVRESIKQNATMDELNRAIEKITENIKLKVKDMMTEYSLHISQGDFIDKMEKITSIDKDFVRLFVKKNHEIHGDYKYCHDEIADFLGYDNVENYKYFIAMMKKELKLNIEYIVVKTGGKISMDIHRDFKTSKNDHGNKTNYFFTRVGFYTLCMVANKPKAKIYRRQFGEVYELALQYTQQAKNNLIGSIQHPKVSEQAITNRMNYKVDSLVKNNNTTKLKKQIDELLEKNKNMQEQINKLNTNVLSQKQTIEDITNKINVKDQIIYKLKTQRNNYLKLIKQFSIQPIQYINSLIGLR